MTDSREELIQLMRETGIAVTRQNYIDLAWGQPLPEWTAELEAELPDELQDWTQFKVDGSELKPK